MSDQTDRRSEEEPEVFYRALWRSPRWGAAEPNDDELSRLFAIKELLLKSTLGPTGLSADHPWLC